MITGTRPAAAASPSATRAASPSTSQVPRLTNAQYDRVVNDLLGVQTLKASNNVQPSTILATDQAGGLTDLGWSSYQSVADMIATQVMADATLKKNFMKCTPTGDGKACLHDTIIKFGRKRLPPAADHRRDRRASTSSSTDGPTITADRDRSTRSPRRCSTRSWSRRRSSQRGEMTRDGGRRGELHAVQPRGRPAALVHALGLDSRRRAEHGGRQRTS